MALAFSPDGTVLATAGSLDSTVQLMGRDERHAAGELDGTRPGKRTKFPPTAGFSSPPRAMG